MTSSTAGREPARTKWSAARHLQEAADLLRAPEEPGMPEPFGASAPHTADLLDATANMGAWLAPFREHEGGYASWRAATRLAHEIISEPDPDTCPVCHTRQADHGNEVVR